MKPREDEVRAKEEEFKKLKDELTNRKVNATKIESPVKQSASALDNKTRNKSALGITS